MCVPQIGRRMFWVLVMERKKKNLVVVALGGSSREKRNSHVYAVPSVTGDPIAPPNAQESLKKLLPKVTIGVTKENKR